MQAATRITRTDRTIIQDLARRVAEIGHLPVQQERIALWKRHNRLDRPRAVIFISPEGAWRELLPESSLRCEGERARRIERALRMQIYWHEVLRDDTVVEAAWTVRTVVRETGWGLEPRRRPSADPTGAWAFDPVLLGPADLAKLRSPELYVDEEATERDLAEAHELFAGILEVRRRGVQRVSFHLMQQYTALRGLGQVMLDMYDNPEMLHDAMAFYEEAHRSRVQQMVELGVLDLNNDNSYHSSGGRGWTDELPRDGFDGTHVRPCDVWASAEAQELAQVSPEMHEEFCLQYERRLLEPFGLNGYGCCEDLTHKLDDVLRVPNILRISISPFADVEACAERLGNRYIFSWKPKPQMVAGDFDPDRIRAYLRHALEATRGCVFEMVLKDTHTCEGRPERFTTWSRIAREEVERLGE